ncbi:putative uncharacterized protein DDB_G0277255 [Pleurodeles waltl]|uniref:putative uncharacterized protein DDB_G0277255 n=1 Tax=Pleurodeles waltl TaxID=8319 RepID=UPI003709B2A2
MGNSPQLSDGSPVHMDCDSRESTNTESAVQLMGSLFITEERMASMDVSHTQEKNEDQYSQDNSTSEEPNSNALSEKSQAEELNSLGAPSKTKEPTLEQPPGKYLTDACVLVEGSHNKNVLQNEEQQDTDVAPSTHNRTTFVEDTALVLKHKENCKQGEKPTTQNMCAEIKLKEEGSSTQIAFTDMQKLQDQCDQPCTQKINSQAKEQRTMESNSSITPRGTQDQGGKGYGPISETMLSNVVHRDNDEKLSSRRGPKEVDRQSNQGTSLSLKITLEASCVNQIQSTQTKTNMERLTLSKEQQYFTTQSANSNGVTITTDSANSKSITGFNNNEEISNVCSDLPKRSHGLLDKVELLGQSYDLSLIRQSHESVVTYRGLDDHPIYIPKLNLQFTPDNSVDVSSLSKLNMNSINVADLQSGAITNSFNRTALSRTVVDISESHIYTDNGKRACSCPARCSNEAHSHPIHKIHPLHRIVDLSLSFTGNLAKDVPEGIPKILLTEEDADED